MNRQWRVGILCIAVTAMGCPWWRKKPDETNGSVSLPSTTLAYATLAGVGTTKGTAVLRVEAGPKSTMRIDVTVPGAGSASMKLTLADGSVIAVAPNTDVDVSGAQAAKLSGAKLTVPLGSGALTGQFQPALAVAHLADVSGWDQARRGTAAFALGPDRRALRYSITVDGVGPVKAVELRGPELPATDESQVTPAIDLLPGLNDARNHSEGVIEALTEAQLASLEDDQYRLVWRTNEERGAELDGVLVFAKKPTELEKKKYCKVPSNRSVS